MQGPPHSLGMCVAVEDPQAIAAFEAQWPCPSTGAPKVHVRAGEVTASFSLLWRGGSFVEYAVATRSNQERKRSVARTISNRVYGGDQLFKVVPMALS